MKWYYYRHDESDTVWRTDKQLSGADLDQGVHEIGGKLYVKLIKEMGQTVKETTITEKDPNCYDCKFCWKLAGGTIEVPYPEFSCMKSHWDGVENPDDLFNKIECKDFEKE